MSDDNITHSDSTQPLKPTLVYHLFYHLPSMELCTARPISCCLLPNSATPSLFQTFSRCRDHSTPLLKQNPLALGLRCYISSPVRSSTSGEVSTETAQYGVEQIESDGGVKVENEGDTIKPFFESDGPETKQYVAEKTESYGVVKEEKKEDSSAQLVEADKTEKEDFDAPKDISQSDRQLSKLLEDLGIKLDLEDKSILVIGGGGIVALWLTATVVGAIDSVPLLPKLLELVGFGYTIWFTIRYLLFKESREELLARIKQFKEEIVD